MPRTVRNFWIDANIDGRQSTLSGGPRSKEDGMTVNLHQRSKGDVQLAVRIVCSVNEDGNLVTVMKNGVTDKEIFRYTTER